MEKFNIKKYPQVSVLKQTPQLEVLLTIIRDQKTKREDFIFHADRIIRLLVEEGLNLLPIRTKTVTTPTGVKFKGAKFVGKICAVSIIRAGESMEKGIRDVCKKIRIGKILIQRDEKTAQPLLFYSKLPRGIAWRYVLLVDPMLATGGSAVATTDILKRWGVNRIKFVGLIGAPEGIENMQEHHPDVPIFLAAIDDHLNERGYIVPGLGDAGDRQFGTA